MNNDPLKIAIKGTTQDHLPIEDIVDGIVGFIGTGIMVFSVFFLPVCSAIEDISCHALKGLDTKEFIPQARHNSISERSRLAVRAITGMWFLGAGEFDVAQFHQMSHKYIFRNCNHLSTSRLSYSKRPTSASD